MQMKIHKHYCVHADSFTPLAALSKSKLSKPNNAVLIMKLNFDDS